MEMLIDTLIPNAVPIHITIFEGTSSLVRETFVVEKAHEIFPSIREKGYEAYPTSPSSSSCWINELTIRWNGGYKSGFWLTLGDTRIMVSTIAVPVPGLHYKEIFPFCMPIDEEKAYLLVHY